METGNTKMTAKERANIYFELLKTDMKAAIQFSMAYEDEGDEEEFDDFLNEVIAREVDRTKLKVYI